MEETTIILDINDKFRLLDEKALPSNLHGRKPAHVYECLPKIYENGYKAKNEKKYDESYIFFKRWIACVNWLLGQQLPKEMKNRFFSNEKVKDVENLLEEVLNKIKLEYETKQRKFEIEDNHPLVTEHVSKEAVRKPSITNFSADLLNTNYNFHSRCEETTSPILTYRHSAGLKVIDPSNVNSNVSVKALLELWEAKSVEKLPEHNTNLKNSQQIPLVSSSMENGNYTEFNNNKSLTSPVQNMDQTITDLNDKYRYLDTEALRPNLEGRRPSLVYQCLPKIYENGYKAKVENKYADAYIFFKRWITCVDWLQKQRLDKHSITSFFSSDKIKDVENLLEEVSNSIKLEYKTKENGFEIGDDKNYSFVTKRRKKAIHASTPDSLDGSVLFKFSIDAEST